MNSILENKKKTQNKYTLCKLVNTHNKKKKIRSSEVKSKE